MLTVNQAVDDNPARNGGRRRPVRVVGVGLLCAGLLAVASCASSSSEQTPPPQSPAPSPSETNADAFTLAAPASVKASGKLKICADIVYPPFTFMENDQPTGIDVDFANALTGAMGAEPEWLQTGYVGIFAALQGGKCDAIINGINGEPGHEQQMAQIPYMMTTKGFIVKKGNPANITSVDDLPGKSIATQLGSSTQTYLEGMNKEFQDQGKEPMKLVTLPQDTAAFSAVLSGRVDAYFQDRPVIGYYASKYPDVEILPIVVAPQTVVVGMRKDDTELVDVVTEGIHKMYELGLMQEIVKKWGSGPENFVANMPGPTS